MYAWHLFSPIQEMLSIWLSLSVFKWNFKSVPETVHISSISILGQHANVNTLLCSYWVTAAVIAAVLKVRSHTTLMWDSDCWRRCILDRALCATIESFISIWYLIVFLKLCSLHLRAMDWVTWSSKKELSD